jgi:hypothetical protein
MGLLSWIGIGKEIAEPIKAASDLYTTEKARIAAETNLELVQQQRGLKQLDNNKIMLIANSVFQSGWQPLTGWTAGFCLALYWVPQLFIANIIWARECLNMGHVIPFPIDPSDIMNLIYLLFGFGTYHLAKKKLIG